MGRGVARGAVAAVLAAAAGCGAAGAPAAPTVTGKELMEDVRQMLTFAAENRIKTPTRPAELEPVEPVAPLAGTAIRDGSVVYAWGSSLAPGGKSVVAYEKKAETEGGWVLLQDGAVREMTADEFRAAPKAKK